MAYFNNKQNIKGAGFLPTPIPSSPSYNPPPIPSSEEGSAVDIPIPVFSGNARVTLYHNADENKVLNKRLSGAKEFDIIIKEETSSITPRIILQSDDDLSNYNYAYIDIAHRYYYCTITYIENGFFSIDMNVDVLMSHKAGIKKLIALVDRTENEVYINRDLQNGDLVNQRGTTTKIIKYTKSLNKEPQLVLVTAGKPIALG